MCKTRAELIAEYRRQQLKKILLDYLGAVAFFGIAFALWIGILAINSCISGG
jgi:hypothetical protein